MDLPGELIEQADELRRRLHRHPELAFQEHQTARVLEEFLAGHGVEIAGRGLAGTGLVALVRGAAAGPCVALRADMDALPIREETGLEWASARDGVMHACGHDGHMALVATTAAWLARHRGELPGTVKFIFQPREEKGNGARLLVEQGVLDAPPVAAIFAVHARPQLAAGQLQLCRVPSAATNPFTIEILGRGGHGAYPHLAVDPIAIGAQVVVALQQVVARQLPPGQPAVVTVGAFSAGEMGNVIPERARLRGTIRTRHPEVRRQAGEAVRRIAAGVAAALGGECRVEIEEGTPRVRNDDELLDLVEAVARPLLGDDNVLRQEAVTMGGEDFSFYLSEQGGVPGCLLWLGVETDEPIHTSRFDFGSTALAPGIRLLGELAYQALQKPPGRAEP